MTTKFVIVFVVVDSADIYPSRGPHSIDITDYQIVGRELAV